MFVCCHDFNVTFFSADCTERPHARIHICAHTRAHTKMNECTDLPLQQQLQHVIRWCGTCPCSKVPDTWMWEHVNDSCIMRNETHTRAKHTMHSRKHPLRLQPQHYTFRSGHYLVQCDCKCTPRFAAKVLSARSRPWGKMTYFINVYCTDKVGFLKRMRILSGIKFLRRPQDWFLRPKIERFFLERFFERNFVVIHTGSWTGICKVSRLCHWY